MLGSRLLSYKSYLHLSTISPSSSSCSWSRRKNRSSSRGISFWYQSSYLQVGFLNLYSPSINLKISKTFLQTRHKIFSLEKLQKYSCSCLFYGEILCSRPYLSSRSVNLPLECLNIDFRTILFTLHSKIRKYKLKNLHIYCVFELSFYLFGLLNAWAFICTNF